MLGKEDENVEPADSESAKIRLIELIKNLATFEDLLDYYEGK